MNIKTAIDRAFSLRPDSFSEEVKVEWLSYLDAQLFVELIQTRENPEGITYSRYYPDNMDQELIIPFPYDKVYVSYLKMKVLEAYGDTEGYNNAAYLYNQDMSEFKSHWGRTHRQIDARRKQNLCGANYVYPCECPLNERR